MGLLALVLAAAPAAAARRPAPRVPPKPAELRFPDTVTDETVRDLLAAGRVELKPTDDPESWKRWGRADPWTQEVAMRAVLWALANSRPTVALSAAILAIARVESGFNPWSQNPSSTACGIFQFVKATWAEYQPVRETCLDPHVNAWAGVRHLTSIYEQFVKPIMPPPSDLPDERLRTEFVYRMLYAYHYHGIASPYAPMGGSLDSQLPADGSVQVLNSFYDLMKKAVFKAPLMPRLVMARSSKRGEAAATTPVKKRAPGRSRSRRQLLQRS